MSNTDTLLQPRLARHPRSARSPVIKVLRPICIEMIQSSSVGRLSGYRYHNPHSFKGGNHFRLGAKAPGCARDRLLPSRRQQGWRAIRRNSSASFIAASDCQGHWGRLPSMTSVSAVMLGHASKESIRFSVCIGPTNKERSAGGQGTQFGRAKVTSRRMGNPKRDGAGSRPFQAFLGRCTVRSA